MRASRKNLDGGASNGSNGSNGSSSPAGSVDSVDSVDPLDELDELDELDAPESVGAPRRRRSYSRPRLKRVNVGKIPRGGAGVSKVKASLAEQAEQAVRRVAAEVARQVSGRNDENLDLECRVAGVTHRGGFKLRVVRLEEMTSAMVDRWRAVCLSRGYASAISFDVTASEAHIVATPILNSSTLPNWCTNWCANWCTKTDPLNALFVGALALNTLRHALDHFAL